MTRFPAASFSVPCARLLVTDDQTTLELWDVANKREVTSIKHEQAPAAPVFSADGAYLAIVGFGAIRIFETTSLLRFAACRSVKLPSCGRIQPRWQTRRGRFE